MRFETVLAAVIVGGVVLLIGSWMGLNAMHRRVLRHSCESACERLGSEMERQYDNTCVCADMTVMRGDYGHLFLHGESR